MASFELIPTFSRIRVLLGDDVVADTRAARIALAEVSAPCFLVPRMDLQAELVPTGDRSEDGGALHEVRVQDGRVLSAKTIVYQEHADLVRIDPRDLRKLRGRWDESPELTLARGRPAGDAVCSQSEAPRRRASPVGANANRDRRHRRRKERRRITRARVRVAAQGVRTRGRLDRRQPVARRRRPHRVPVQGHRQLLRHPRRSIPTRSSPAASSRRRRSSSSHARSRSTACCSPSSCVAPAPVTS